MQKCRATCLLSAATRAFTSLLSADYRRKGGATEKSCPRTVDIRRALRKSGWGTLMAKQFSKSPVLVLRARFIRKVNATKRYSKIYLCAADIGAAKLVHSRHVRD